jgi:hypothetical protein
VGDPPGAWFSEPADPWWPVFLRPNLYKLASYAAGWQHQATLGGGDSRKQCPSDVGGGDGPVVRRNKRAEESAHNDCQFLERALWLAEYLAVSRKQRRASNDQTVERKLRQRLLEFTLYAVVEDSGFRIRTHRTDQAGVPSTYSKRCASDGEIGIEINSPERGLAARHLDGSTECEVNLIEGGKRWQRNELHHVRGELGVRCAQFAPA